MKFQALPFFEPATGLIAARHRWYDLSTGTFLSPDPLGYNDSSNLYAFAGGDPVNGRDPLGLAKKPKCLFIEGKTCGDLWRQSVDGAMEATFGSLPASGRIFEAPSRALLKPGECVADYGETPGEYAYLLERSTFHGELIDPTNPEHFEVTAGAAADYLMLFAPVEMLEGEFPIRRKTRAVKQKPQPVDVGISWGKGVQKQGMPWEDHVEKQLPVGSRLPKNYKTFDFFVDETGVAISGKTLDTTTAARLAKPEQLYSSLVRNIDAAANFTSYELKGVALSSEMVTAREVRVAIPFSTNATQLKEIQKAVSYGKSQGVKVIVTVTQ